VLRQGKSAQITISDSNASCAFPLMDRWLQCLPLLFALSFLVIKSLLKEMKAFLLTCKNCPADRFWVGRRSPAASSGTAQEQMLRAIAGEAGCILQHCSADRSALSCCPRVCSVVPLTEMRVWSFLCFSVYVFSFQYLFKITSFGTVKDDAFGALFFFTVK